MTALMQTLGCTASKTLLCFLLLWLRKKPEQKPKANSQLKLQDSSSLENPWFHSVIQSQQAAEEQSGLCDAVVMEMNW